MEKVPLEGFTIIGLDIVGFNRTHLFKNITLPFKLVQSIFKARSIIKNFQPDVVIGVGGYASFPMLNAAQSLGIPTLIQEQNSYAGKSNKILSKRADRICVAYEHMEAFFPKTKIEFTGNPVRSLIVNASIDAIEAKRFFGLNQSKKTILIVGGSLGAKSINDTIAKDLNVLLNQNVQLLWQTGKSSFEEARIAASKNLEDVKVHAFIKEMDMAYAAADMIVSRAGALAIAELCIVEKPVIFVPYPYAAEDHQTTNAQALVKQDAAIMIEDKNVSNKLSTQILELLIDTEKQRKMSEAIKKLAVRDADIKIANSAILLTSKKTA
jgi:UDP-N-acetylglucosamine--N-acetylmuramyl-(pentapeptide) pyrophosphoryl-undecaprenol N-acetylglucosamine transferase